MQPTLIAFRQFRNSWRQMLRLGLLALAALNPPAFLLAQNPARGIKFERIGLEQGLSQIAIYCALQDRQGFMWFGTENGLNQYDGYKFTVYKNDPQDSTSISDSWITSLFEDHTGTLWIGTPSGGLNRFDRDKEQFTRFNNDPNNPHSLSNSTVNVIYEDRAGTLWIGADRGLNKFDREKEQFIRFDYDPNAHATDTLRSVRLMYKPLIPLPQHQYS